MQFRHLQHYILGILFTCGSILSIVFSAITFQLIQSQAIEDSQELTTNLINTVKASAGAAVFAGNKMVGQDAIDGLLANDAVYSVELVGFADEASEGMQLSGINKSGVNKNGGSGLAAITVELVSPFGDSAIGKISVQPSAQWVERNAQKSAFSMIMGLVVVIFSSCLVTAQLIKWKISKPLVDVVNQLQQIEPGSETRLTLPTHLKLNEIGSLVGEFNTMLDQIKQAILVERGLREDMEAVQVSLERAKQVAEHATEAKSNFLATMSHEIRTPMNSILGFVELALESPKLDGQTRRHLEIANTSAKFLLQLINDILDVSKIESGKLELDIHAFDLAALLNEVNDLMEIKAAEKSLALNLHRPDKMAPSYMGDPYRLRQIFINLVGNAIKFTETGQVELDVQLKELNGDRAIFEFSIVDTGIGIAEDKIEQILKPFTQVDASISRQFGGTGLGTTISSELVQLMGGELKIQSILGKGSRFYFVIELEQSDQILQVESIPVAQAAPEQSLEPLNILLVDDVLENITLAKIRLENAGHNVSTAEDGLQAVEAALNTRFDVILMDIQMPNMDGYEATHAIREQQAHDGHNKAVPIVALTANAMKDVQGKVKDAGMTEFVVKPIDFDDLFATLEKVVPDKVANIAGNTMVALTADGECDYDSVKHIVDVNTAIESWLEKDTYFAALNGFYQRNLDTNNALQCLVNSQDKAGLDSLTHKIKGAAGNLQLKHLYHQSVQLEEHLSQLQSSLSLTLVAPIIQAMEQTQVTIAELVGISTEYQADESSEQNQTITISQEDKDQCLACVAQIIEGCEQHDPDMAESGLEQLGQYLDASVLAEIDAKLQQFDFAATEELITALREEM